MSVSIPAYKPKTPFIGRIPGGFQPSLMIRMKGKMTEKRGSCTIDFLNTSPTSDVNQDIMLHISIRLDDKCIVQNSYINKQWEIDEKYEDLNINFLDAFEIDILAEYPHYSIFINGVHLGIFQHRLPLNLVQYIKISGNIEIDHILLEQNKKSAQKQAAMGYLANSSTSFKPKTQYRVGLGTFTSSSTTSAAPIQNYPRYVPVQTYQISRTQSNNQSINHQENNLNTIENQNDLPPPYHQVARLQ